MGADLTAKEQILNRIQRREQTVVQLVMRGGRRISGAGQPAIVYRIPEQAEDALSKIYKPVLLQLLDLLPDKLTEQEMVALMKETGRRMAENTPPAGGNLREKVEAAAQTLNQLGALIELDEVQQGLQLSSYSCPLAKAVRCRPEVCNAVTGFLEEVTSTKVHENCKREQSPLKCRFIISMNSRGQA